MTPARLRYLLSSHVAATRAYDALRMGETETEAHYRARRVEARLRAMEARRPLFDHVDKRGPVDLDGKRLEIVDGVLTIVAVHTAAEPRGAA